MINDDLLMIFFQLWNWGLDPECEDGRNVLDHQKVTEHHEKETPSIKEHLDVENIPIWRTPCSGEHPGSGKYYVLENTTSWR